MIHKIRIRLAPLMASHGQCTTGVLVVSKQVGHPNDNLMTTTLQCTRGTLQPASMTHWLVSGLNHDRPRRWGVNGYATGVTAVQLDRRVIPTRMVLLASTCVKFDRASADRGMFPK
jgi:hypothetical protein